MSRAGHEATLLADLAKIRADFTKMCAVGVDLYLDRQIGKYLKPLDRAGFVRETRKLLRIFTPAVDGVPFLMNVRNDVGAIPLTRPNWDTEGVDEDHVKVSRAFKLGGGYSGIGKFGGLKIRINQKAFYLTRALTRRGIIVHEATHFVLSTEDIHYSTFTKNSTMQALANGSENADNWRIFYQKMSATYARTVSDIPP